jgi:hypothetical protein
MPVSLTLWVVILNRSGGSNRILDGASCASGRPHPASQPRLKKDRTGWIQYEEGDLQAKVTFETRLHEKAPFGVVSCRTQFEVRRDGKVLHTIDATAKLTDFGTDAQTALPDHK